MKNVKKIVLTGGPAAGKTTLLSRIVKDFSEKGYRVIVVPETATDLISGFGVKPFGNCISMLEFQDFVFSYQISKEELADKASEIVPEQNLIIVYDRGLFDNKAYVSSEEFKNILERFNLTDVEVYDRYDAVIHMVSSAVGAEEFYNLDNAARTETVEQAKELDKKTMNCWVGHKNLIIVNNSTNFEDKINRALKEIYKLLGDPIPTQIQKKYLVSIPNAKILKDLEAVSSDILQVYLKSNENVTERRIRQRTINGDSIYLYTEKKNIDFLERVDLERKITQKQYMNYFSEIDSSKHPLIKKRYSFVWENQYFELDIFSFEEEKALLQITLTERTQKVDIPDCIKVLKEVTNDENYMNYKLAEKLKF